MNFFESPAEFDFTQAPQSVRDRSVFTFYTQNFIRLRGAKISMENLRGAKISKENLRGAKISKENLRGLKKFHYFPKNTPTGYPDLKKTDPLCIFPCHRDFTKILHDLATRLRQNMHNLSSDHGNSTIFLGNMHNLSPKNTGLQPWPIFVPADVLAVGIHTPCLPGLIGLTSKLR